MQFSIQDNVIAEDLPTIFEELSQLLIMLTMSGIPLVERVPPYRETLFDLLMTYDEIEGIFYGTPPNRANSVFHRKHLHLAVYNQIEELRDRYENEIKSLKHLYAMHYAERAFHDRELCQYISFMLVSLFDNEGFPELNADGSLAISKVGRVKWPSWVLRTLRSRERNRCAKCQNSLSELEGRFHIDHIIPLAQGG